MPFFITDQFQLGCGGLLPETCIEVVRIAIRMTLIQILCIVSVFHQRNSFIIRSGQVRGPTDSTWS